MMGLALAACATTEPDPRQRADHAVTVVSSSLVDWLTNMPRASEKSGASPMRPPACLEAFERGLQAAIQNDVQEAQQALSECDYAIGRVVEPDRTYLVIFEDEPTAVGATVVLAAAEASDILVEAPHPIFESATVLQAATAMRLLNARAAIVAGAHRCASADVSPCSGKTSVCGTKDAPYPVSDVAHHTANTFHSAHEVLTASTTKAIVVQFHIMGSNENTKVVVSDSTTRDEAGDAQLTGRLRDALRAELGGPPETVVSCQDQNDRRFKFRRLCGTANVQARQLYGSNDACTAEGPSPTGRFIHLEQHFELLETEPGRAAIMNGLRRTLSVAGPVHSTPGP